MIASFPAATAPPEPASRTRKFTVQRLGAGWTVSIEDAAPRAFTSREAAVEHACQRGREAGAAGLVGLVVVLAELQEFHCFTPNHEAGT